MKKSNFLVQKLIIALLVLSIVSCGKNGVVGVDTQKCEAKAKAVSDATTRYTSAPTKANCEALKNVLQEYVNDGGGCGVSDADVNAARNLIETLTCQ